MLQASHVVPVETARKMRVGLKRTRATGSTHKGERVGPTSAECKGAAIVILGHLRCLVVLIVVGRVLGRVVQVRCSGGRARGCLLPLHPVGGDLKRWHNFPLSREPGV